MQDLHLDHAYNKFLFILCLHARTILNQLHDLFQHEIERFLMQKLIELPFSDLSFALSSKVIEFYSLATVHYSKSVTINK